MSLKSQIAPKEESNLVELKKGTSGFIGDSDNMPWKQSTKSSFLGRPLSRVNRWRGQYMQFSF